MPKADGQFKPGQSGNPSGRPKALKLVEALAREHTVEAMETLVEIMQDKASPAPARVSAAGTILDRGWGKAPQSVSIEGEIDVRTLDDAGLDEALRAELARYIGAPGGGDSSPKGRVKLN